MKKNSRAFWISLLLLGALFYCSACDNGGVQPADKSDETDNIDKPDKTALTRLVQNAKTVIAGARKSADGEDVPAEAFWVSEAVYDALEEAIADAEKALPDEAAAQDDIDRLRAALQKQITDFTNAKKPGLYTPPPPPLPEGLIPAGPGWARNSVNTTPFRQNSIVTHGDTQFIAYFDSDGTAVIGKRTLDEKEFTLSDTGISGWPTDAHNSISIMTDGDAYLHMVLGHHNSALAYYKSAAPLSTGFSPATMLQNAAYQNSVTYPEFYRLPSGDLLFVYRNGGSGDGYMVLNRYSTQTKTWTRVHDRLVHGTGASGTQSPYWQMYLDAKGTLHLSWVFRRTPDVRTNHDMYYAYSEDQGQTWKKKSNGAAYTMPITPDNAEKIWSIPEDSSLMNQTSMTADDAGNPYIATYWKEGGGRVQYRVIYHDGTAWNARQVSNRAGDFTLGGGGTLFVPIARPRLVAKHDAASGKTKAYYIFRDTEEREGKVSLYRTDDIESGVWTVKDLTDFPVYAWEPSHDTELWKNQGKLHIFVQFADQASGEGLTDHEPEMVYCLEADVE
jgi:hypothetical protein